MFIRTLLIFTLVVACLAWDSTNLQMYDLVDELKISFYEFLGVKEDAKSDEIRKAYRKLSIKMHPDKNTDDPNASEKFRQLVAVYEILKDPELRERYNEVLVNGMPDWRNAVFYYRKLRRMSNMELFTLFSILATTIHYAVLWGSRYEKLWNMEEQLSTFYKRHKAKDKKREVIEMEIAERLKEVPKPKWHDLLPFALCKGTYYLALWLPVLLAYMKSQLFTQLERFQQERQFKRELIEEHMLKGRVKAERREQKRRQLEQKQSEPSPYGFDSFGGRITLSDIPPEVPSVTSVNENTRAGREWTEEDLINLVRAVARFPGGVPDRWVRISEQLNRPVTEVIGKVKELGEKGMNAVYLKSQSSYAIPSFEVNENDVCGESSEGSDEEDNETAMIQPVTNDPKSVPTESLHNGFQADHPARDDEVVEAVATAVDEPYVSRRKQKLQLQQRKLRKEVEPGSSDGWTQVEQKQLEVAIRSIDKSTPERWDRIAECVPTKTKAEVMQRVKHLSNLVKARGQRL